MMARRSAKRKYHPGFESLEVKQFLAAGLLVGGAEALVRATTFAVSTPECRGIRLCGTGKGIVIITQCVSCPPIRYTGR